MLLRSLENFLGQLIDRSDAKKPSPPGTPLREQPLRWGNVYLTEQDAQSHFLAAGTTGSGKTSILRLLMQTVLPKVGTGDYRALIYDAKLDALPIVAAIAPSQKVITINPFDQRGAAWDIATDLTEPRLIYEVAATLFPQQPDTTQFFRNATVHVVYGIMFSFLLSGIHFTLADVFRALRSYQAIIAILQRHRETAYIAEYYFRDKKLRHNILASFAVNALPYEHAASCWEHASEKVSLKEWSQTDMILILGNTEVSRAALDNINRCLFKLASNLILDKPESRTSSSWFFLDEVSEAGKLDGLVSLLKKGRSKGAKVALAFQSISGLRAPTLYGPQGADEILGQIGTRFIGRLECVATAEYFSQLVGEQEIVSVSSSYSTGSQSSSSTVSYSRRVKKALLASQLIGIRPCSIDNGLTGYCTSPDLGIFKTHIHGTDLFEKDLIPPDSTVPHFLPRPPTHQVLRKWTKREARKLKVRSSAQKRLPQQTDTTSDSVTKQIKAPSLVHDPLQGAFE